MHITIKRPGIAEHIPHRHRHAPFQPPFPDMFPCDRIDRHLLQNDGLDRLADVLVNYSTGVRKGDLVRVTGPVVGRPLLAAIYRAVLEIICQR